MRIFDMSEYLGFMDDLINNKNETVMATNKETCILQGEGEFNSEFCTQNNLPVYKTHYFGGTIVNFIGDICVGDYRPNFNSLGREYMNLVKNYLINKGINATVEGNDVIIDSKYKVASYMSTYINNCLYTAAHISINTDLDLIKNVCAKEMVKIPKGLSEYGITSEEIQKLFEEYINQNK